MNNKIEISFSDLLFLILGAESLFEKNINELNPKSLHIKEILQRAISNQEMIQKLNDFSGSLIAKHKGDVESVIICIEEKK